jgi:hypothetical protein
MGGRIAVDTANVELDSAGKGGREVELPGSYVLLAVTAAGYGVQSIPSTPLLEMLMERCGGYLRILKESEAKVALITHLPRVEILPRAASPSDQTVPATAVC